MKRFLATFFFAIIALSTWAYDCEVDGIYYNLISKNKGAKVTSGDTKYTGTVTIPETIVADGVTYSVTSIGEYAFAYCSGLTSVTISNSVTSIGDWTFSGCSGLTSVTIPNSVMSIGEGAFWYCKGLTSVTIPNSVTSIGSSAFSDCSSLPVIDNIRYADTYLVEAVDKTLSEYNIKSDTRFIGSEAFHKCTSLTSVTIPNSVTSIGSSAFSECTGLTSVTIPNSVTSIGEEAFSGCSGLTSVTIGNSVTSIGNYAFHGCSGLTSMTIPNSVTSIGLGAFQYCRGLTSVTIGNSVTSIGENAFYGCSGLTSVTIPNSVTSIGEWAFEYCTGLTSVTIGNSVTSIGREAFYGCTGLTKVNISDIASWVKISFSDVNSNPLYYAHHLYLNDEEVKDLVIPNSVTSIGRWAFLGCSDLTSVTIPNSVTSIGREAFNDCSGLTKVNISDIASWTKISFVLTGYNVTSNPLYYAHHLYLNDEEVKDLVIPNSVTSIGNYAFRGCTGLTSVTIPESVTSIGEWAFNWCSNLTNLVYNAKNATVSTSTSYLSFPKTLTNVTIGDEVESIPAYFIYGNKSVTSITIPNSVTSIGDYAFSGCTGLREVHSQNITPPTCTTSTFEGVKTANCPLYVPTGTKSDYAFADGWADFVNIIEEEVVNPSGSLEKPTISYENKQLYFSCSTAGVKYVYTIKAEDNTTSLQDCENGTVDLSATYIITAYAKTDTETSEPATATLVWATGTLETEDINEVKSFSVDALPLLISQDNGFVTVSGLQNGDVITAYTTNGTEVTKSQASGSAALLNLTELQGKVAILSINGKSAKIMVK